MLCGCICLTCDGSSIQHQPTSYTPPYLPPPTPTPPLPPTSHTSQLLKKDHLISIRVSNFINIYAPVNYASYTMVTSFWRYILLFHMTLALVSVSASVSDGRCDSRPYLKFSSTPLQLESTSKPDNPSDLYDVFSGRFL